MSEIVFWQTILWLGLGLLFTEMVWIFALKLPLPRYVFGFKKIALDYDNRPVVLYYKVLREKGDIRAGGVREVTVHYLLRDQATRWSPFYVEVIAESKLASLSPHKAFVFVRHFKTVDPRSDLQRIILEPVPAPRDIEESIKNIWVLEDRFLPLVREILRQEKQQSIDLLISRLKQPRLIPTVINKVVNQSARWFRKIWRR